MTLCRTLFINQNPLKSDEDVSVKSIHRDIFKTTHFRILLRCPYVEAKNQKVNEKGNLRWIQIERCSTKYLAYAVQVYQGQEHKVRLKNYSILRLRRQVNKWRA